MPLQNRIDPWGRLVAVCARGAWLGNRGILHNEQKQIVAQWRHKSWVTCQLEFKGRQRKVFGLGGYSELFFLDEATALAAGHRPCAECRRSRFNDFKSAWITAHSLEGRVPVTLIDKQMHADRAVRGGGKVTHLRGFVDLPDGVFIEWDGDAYLVWCGALRKWSPEGYVGATPLPDMNEVVVVLTPSSVVEVFKHAFTPQVHPSAYGS